MKKTAIFITIVLILFLSSCDSFFSKSLGSFREYDPAKINVTAANVDEWIRASVGNPALAKAVYEAIQRELKKPSVPDKPALREAGLRLAIISSGLGELILTDGAAIFKDIDFDNIEDPEELVKEILDAIINGFESYGGSDAADAITDLLAGVMNDPDDDDYDYPKFDGTAESFTAGDVAEAILILVLAELSRIMADVDDFFDEWDGSVDNLGIGLGFKDGHVVIDGDPSDNAPTLAAYLNLIIEDKDGKFDDNPLTRAIKDALLSGTNP